jgi:choline dehydrogenase-like flavoprotein
MREGRSILRALIPAMSILGIHHEDQPTPRKTAVLRHAPAAGDAPGDRLDTEYAVDEAEDQRQRRTEREVLRLFRRLGCVALRRVDLGRGASIHYGATLPMREKPGPLETDRDGRLGGHGEVYVADSAVFPRLPAKGVTFTMMANAHRIGSILARSLA